MFFSESTAFVKQDTANKMRAWLVLPDRQQNADIIPLACANT
jgi:hypothetical protein